MNEQQTNELKVARALVGGIFFWIVWQIWNALDVSVFAVQATNPQLSATGFSAGVLLTDVLGPLLLTALFVFSRTGELVLKFAARLVGMVESRTSGSAVDASAFAKSDVTNRNFKSLDSRLKKIEDTVAGWTEE